MIEQREAEPGDNANNMHLHFKAPRYNMIQIQLISQVKFHKNISYFPTNIPTSSVLRVYCIVIASV